MDSILWIGVDGGGTKTQVRIEDSNGRCLGEIVTGPSNIALSVPAAWQAIMSGIATILKSHEMTLNDARWKFRVGMGLAGSEIAAARADFLAMPHSFEALKLISDAHIACVGAHGGQDGAVIMLGTGVIGYQIEDHQVNRVSGWGFPHDDEGSGAWLGCQAVSATLKAWDGRQHASLLTQKIQHYFNQQLSDLLHFAANANSTQYATLAPLVIAVAEQHCPDAMSLMQQSAQAIETIWQGLMQTQKRALPCVLSGGLAAFIQPLLSTTLQDRLVAAKARPVEGAICWMKEGK